MTLHKKNDLYDAAKQISIKSLSTTRSPSVNAEISANDGSEKNKLASVRTISLACRV